MSVLASNPKFRKQQAFYEEGQLKPGIRTPGVNADFPDVSKIKSIHGSWGLEFVRLDKIFTNCHALSIYLRSPPRVALEFYELVHEAWFVIRPVAGFETREAFAARFEDLRVKLLAEIAASDDTANRLGNRRRQHISEELLHELKMLYSDIYEIRLKLGMSFPIEQTDTASGRGFLEETG